MIIDEKSAVWAFLEAEQRDLFCDASYLITLMRRDERVLTDYSFLVFPVAKAYEGFLKKLFFQSGFMTEEEYRGDRFRVGRALNPELESHFRRESVYDKLVEFCGQDPTVPTKLWEAWKRGRNRLFHYFSDHLHCITREEAEEIIHEISTVMELALQCFVKTEPVSSKDKS